MKKVLAKRLVATILTLLMLSMVFTACTKTPSDTTSSDSPESPAKSEETTTSEPEQNSSDSDEPQLIPSGETLVVGVQSSMISVPTVYAYEKGYFEEVGLDVELIMFPNGSPENEGLAAGQLDVASNGLASIFSMASGLCYWVGETDTSRGTCHLLARPDSPVFDYQGEIEDHPDIYGTTDVLKGLKVLGAANTVSMQIAYAYMARFGLEPGKDFEFLNLNNTAAVQAFISGEGDLIGAASIFVSQLHDAGMKTVAIYEDVTDGTLLNGILARKEVVEERRDDVALFLKAMYKAADELMNDPELRFDYTMQFFTENGKEYTEEALRADIAKKDFVTADMMQQEDYIFGIGMIHMGEFFADTGTIEPEQIDNVITSIDASLIEEALGIEVQVP